MILGIDEVGRGPWAGPLVMGAVVLGDKIEGLADSKKLSKKRREELSLEIQKHALAYATGWVPAAELDEIGLSEALKLATRRAVAQVHTPYHEIIIDGTINFLVGTNKESFVTTLAKADNLIASVSAASIIAKVARDHYMIELGAAYPEYGFEQHMGYGVAKHRAAIAEFGVTPEHRLSFAPLHKYRGEAASVESRVKPVTTRQIGDLSESVAALELELRGHKIVDRNWKTKYCEIDIVSSRRGTIYFTEVKHRRDDKNGDGLAAITPKKLQQMTFAAKIYAQAHNIKDTGLQLVAIATAGDQPHVTDFIEIIVT
ncbi:MAG: ribonuclease HII [Candidatus Saccharimonas sp.]